MKNRMQDLDFEQTVAFDSVKDFEFTRKAAQRFRFQLVRNPDVASVSDHRRSRNVRKISEPRTGSVTKFLHQIMHGCHLMNTVHIFSAENETVLYVSSDCIDQCFCDTIRH